MSDQTLRSHLRHIRDHGWTGDEGAAVFKHFGQLCDAAIVRWRAGAGGLLGRDGVSMLWEYVTELFATYEDVEDFPRYLQSYVNRIYVGQAAAAQTGMGSPLRRGLADVAKQSQPLLGDAALEDLPAPDPDDESRRWLHLGTQLLEDAGWAWPIPAELALDAASGCGVDGRRPSGAGAARRSPLAAHPTGVPADTWAALELLALGSSAGCEPEHRWPGLILMTETMTDQQIITDRNVLRIVHAAVAGKAARTGRDHYGPSSNAGG
jgi:hypothetical protein